MPYGGVSFWVEREPSQVNPLPLLGFAVLVFQCQKLPDVLMKYIPLSLLGKCHSSLSPLSVITAAPEAILLCSDTKHTQSFYQGKYYAGICVKGRRNTDKVVITAQASFCIASAKS